VPFPRSVSRQTRKRRCSQTRYGTCSLAVWDSKGHLEMPSSMGMRSYPFPFFPFLTLILTLPCSFSCFGCRRHVAVVLLQRIDLDIEQGTPTGYAAFVNRLRQHASNGTNKLYITAAPQCPFPDANIGQALNQAPFDAVYVQFCTLLPFLFYFRVMLIHGPKR